MRTRRDHGSMIRVRIISILLRNGRFLRHFSFPVPQLQRNYDGAFRRFLLGNDRFFPDRSLTDWKTYVPVTWRPGYERVAAICKKIKLIQRIRETRTRMLGTEHHDPLCRSSPSGTGSHDLFCRVLNVTMLNLSVSPTDHFKHRTSCRLDSLVIFSRSLMTSRNPAELSKSLMKMVIQ